jgi:hypothetical protein
MLCAGMCSHRIKTNIGNAILRSTHANRFDAKRRKGPSNNPRNAAFLGLSNNSKKVVVFRKGEVMISRGYRPSFANRPV